MLPKFDLQIMTKFDLQILTKFGYTEMSARACCMRECPRSLHERALARCTREHSLHERALAARESTRCKNDQILVISFGYG